MFSIGAFARLGGVTPRTLRSYEEPGRPEDLGLSLAQVAELVDHLSPEQRRDVLLRKRAEIAARLVEDRDRLERVERAFHRLEGAAMILDIVVRSEPPRRVATVVNRHLAAGFDDPIIEEGEGAMRGARRGASSRRGRARPAARPSSNSNSPSRRSEGHRR